MAASDLAYRSGALARFGNRVRAAGAPWRRLAHAGAAGALLALLWLVPLAAARADDGVTLTRAVLQVRHGANAGAFVDAQFDMNLPASLRDAVDHGIALYFLVELQVSRSRWYWFDKRLIDDAVQYRLSFSPLTRQYRLTRNGGLAQPFDTIEQALAAVRRVAQWRVGDAGLFDGGKIQARIRLRLDTSMLPKPFQVSAMTARDWNLGSDWSPLLLSGDIAP